MVRLWPNLVHTPADPWQCEAELTGYDWAKGLQLSMLAELGIHRGADNLPYAELAHCSRADQIQPSWHCAADRWELTWPLSVLVQDLYREDDGGTCGNDMSRSLRRHIVLWNCLELRNRFFRWFCAWLAGASHQYPMLFSASLSHRHYCRTVTIMKDLESAGCAADCITTSHVLVNAAMHHVCPAGRPSTLGQHSAFKPNLATIKYLNV